MISERCKKEIMEESRHQFIYGYNGVERENFLRSLETEYPIRVETDSPMALYVDDLCLPEAEDNEDCLDLLPRLCAEHFEFAVGCRLLSKMQADLSQDVLNARIEELLKLVNCAFLNRSHANIMSFEELLEALKISREFYREYYVCKPDRVKYADINDLKIPFLRVDSLVYYVKKTLENSGYFGIIVDHQKPFALHTYEAINRYVNSRINRDVSMKVAIMPDEWKTYRDRSFNFIQAQHDYGTVELDDSHKRYIMQQKKKWSDLSE